MNFCEILTKYFECDVLRYGIAHTIVSSASVSEIINEIKINHGKILICGIPEWFWWWWYYFECGVGQGGFNCGPSSHPDFIKNYFLLKRMFRFFRHSRQMPYFNVSRQNVAYLNVSGQKVTYFNEGDERERGNFGNWLISQANWKRFVVVQRKWKCGRRSWGGRELIFSQW